MDNRTLPVHEKNIKNFAETIGVHMQPITIFPVDDSETQISVSIQQETNAEIFYIRKEHAEEVLSSLKHLIDMIEEKWLRS